MKKMDDDLLEILNDDDIKVIIAETKMDTMLVLFKQNSKTYAKYIPRLGRLDTKSKMAKTNLPGIVYELYNKGDVNIRKLLFNQAQLFKNAIVELLTEYEKEKLTPESFLNIEASKCVDILLDFENTEASNLVDIDLFFLQLKLNAVDISEQKKSEIKKLWIEQKEKEKVEKERRQEMADTFKALEDSHKSEIKKLRKDYESRISAAVQEIKSLETKMKKQEDRFIDLSSKAELQKEKEVKELLEKIDNLQKELEEKKTELSDTELELEGLKEKIENQKADFTIAWRKEIEAENEELIRTRTHLTNEKDFIQTQIDNLIDDRRKAEEELEVITESISFAEKQYSVLQSDIESRSDVHFNSTMDVYGNSAPVQVGSPRLYIEPGTNAIQKEVCEKYSQYVMAVETNLDIVGYEMTSEKIEDFFNAVVDSNLVPLLCGFGARKAAMALIAARYGEIPTIMSIPAGYSDVDVLSREIDEAETDVVIIEDLFGRMNEDIILPVLRRDIDKLLVFCAESFDCIKYVNSYFMNYVQLIKVNIVSHKKMSALVFADARNLFAKYAYSEKSDMHKKVKRLLKGINISDAYVRSRGDLLTYLHEVVQHEMETVFREWFEHELLEILKPEQKQIIKERLSRDSFGISEELLERFSE